MSFKKLLPSFTAHALEDLSRTGIYSIVNKVNGKFYIGSASVDDKVPSQSGFYARWAHHLGCLNRGEHGNLHLQRAWNKYGAVAFRFQILEFVEPEHCIEVEQTYLDLFPEGDRDLVYNICFIAGSGLGYKHTEEAKRKSGETHALEYSLVSPKGVIHSGKNLKKFCEENKIDSSNIGLIKRGVILQHKGWTLTLEAHQLYMESYLDRGISRRADRNTWRVVWNKEGKVKTKDFKLKEDARNFRDTLVQEGYVFRVRTDDNWREKLNAAQIESRQESNRTPPDTKAN